MTYEQFIQNLAGRFAIKIPFYMMKFRPNLHVKLSTIKYKRHQGAKEKARRLRQMEARHV